MKLKLIFLLPLMTFAAALLPQTALADSLTLNLGNPIQSVTKAGGTLSYTGTIAAAGTNTGFEYLNGDSFSFNGPGTVDDSSFFANPPMFLTAGQSYTGVLFTVMYSNNSAPGVYPGSFSILGGSTDSVFNTLATASFQANVLAPAAVTPEPSSLLLLCTGMFGVMGMARRRLRP